MDLPLFTRPGILKRFDEMIADQTPSTVDSFHTASSCGFTEEEIENPLNSYGVGIDCHSRFIQVCVLINKGTSVVRKEFEFPNEPKSLLVAKQWILLALGGLEDEDNLNYVIESTGNYHIPVLLHFKAHPHVVNPLLANPSRRKTDVLDARLLAKHGLSGLWPESYVMPADVQELRVLVKRRDFFQALRTRTSNFMNNTILRFGHNFGSYSKVMDTHSRPIFEDICEGRKPIAEGVADIEIPESCRVVLSECIKEWDFYNGNVKDYDARIKKKIENMKFPCKTGFINGKELMDLLKTTPGVGTVCATTWLCEVYDPRRFSSSKSIAAFAGCDPSLKVSAGKVTSQTRRGGNTRLHIALMSSAGCAIRAAKEPFGQWGRSLMARQKKGGWKKACNAVGRRIAIALWAIHNTSSPFSYDTYSFYKSPIVSFIPIEDCGFSSAILKKLKNAGVVTSLDLANRFNIDLAKVPGIGSTTMERVSQWLKKNAQ